MRTGVRLISRWWGSRGAEKDDEEGLSSGSYEPLCVQGGSNETARDGWFKVEHAGLVRLRDDVNVVCKT